MTNEFLVTGKQTFMNKEIPIVLGGFGNGKKCICDKTIAEIHGIRAGHVRDNVINNITRFTEFIDFIDLAQRSDENGTLELLLYLGYSK